METKKFKITGNKRAKGGVNNTRTTLTAAGISAVSAAAGVAAGVALSGEDQKPHEEDLQAQDEVQNPQQEEVTQVVQPEQPESPEGPVTEPQPTDTVPTNPANGGNTPDDVDPDAVAENILREDEIDANDMDDNMFTVEGFKTIIGDDGEETVAAVLRTQDGAEYYLADNGEGIYNEVYDPSGNFIGLAEGNLTAGDLVIMSDDSGGYIAAVEELSGGDDPINGIVDTEDSSELAMNEGSVPTLPEN